MGYLTDCTRQERFYVVSQYYARAEEEIDHSKTPVLFTPYKDAKEAAQHFRMLSDKYAGYVDIRTPKVSFRLKQVCSGHTDIAPYIALPENISILNSFLQLDLMGNIRSWVKKNREGWIIREHNSLQPSFVTVRGEPMINIKWGSHTVMVRLDELEGL